ncbi:MAG: hypothetical protein ATN36_03590 [Epulopiscium sp. Nele67-Bin005]|nr:MAG: hypothetical protein ATN36_03590 [Epulopiscium sp. Nele67-Bin005]
MQLHKTLLTMCFLSLIVSVVATPSPIYSTTASLNFMQPMNIGHMYSNQILLLTLNNDVVIDTTGETFILEAHNGSFLETQKYSQSKFMSADGSVIEGLDINISILNPTQIQVSVVAQNERIPISRNSNLRILFGFHAQSGIPAIEVISDKNSIFSSEKISLTDRQATTPAKEFISKVYSIPDLDGEGGKVADIILYNIGHNNIEHITEQGCVFSLRLDENSAYMFDHNSNVELISHKDLYATTTISDKEIIIELDNETLKQCCDIKDIMIEGIHVALAKPVNAEINPVVIYISGDRMTETSLIVGY